MAFGCEILRVPGKVSVVKHCDLVQWVWSFYRLDYLNLVTDFCLRLKLLHKMKTSMSVREQRMSLE